ncbi:type II toxin-antitoxin system RelE/ParE family toxin [Asticcacaulis sp.]|uniref:type II toxin-antitoxin system RelE/ParE family toxin n=1 Tax=unclassified Asticcacaulis TaxID=2628350 RepID=UPI0025C70BD8|nr:type II toxin-antitoxin system RelE/ParE family toxin [Asticcacaulis sp.]MCA1935739.1 type II toxin-antitoxin system RelE/ParE family toxin [Asticcacaulis sp.]
MNLKFARERYQAHANFRFRTLGENPRSGAARYELGQGVRFLSHGNYNIYYRIGENVEILRILHGARQVGEDDI